MKGFKSFADPTTIELEPGITVVVGPNGSGKSNVVDAVAWVLGAQGPRVVRSAKMDDVIFVGTQRRAALGRAEVTLTIDNSDQKLPIEFSEVTIRRTLFRSGDSEYELNGVACRLLDIQELLSDSGVGRTQHVIVSQGQLDGILSASPEERRAVIEEAAGVLKFRRRRERAARRLDASEQGLVRVQDLLREVRRQLRPLERQAASAHQHSDLTAELDRLRRFIAARELRALQSSRSGLATRAAELEANSVRLAQLIEAAAVRVEAAESVVSLDPPDELAVPLARLGQLQERARGLIALMEERSRSKVALLGALDDSTGLASLRESLERTVADISALGVEEEKVSVARRELAEKESELVAHQATEGLESGDVSASDVTARATTTRNLFERTQVLLTGHQQRLERVVQRVGLLEARLGELSDQRRSTELTIESLTAQLGVATSQLDRASASADAAEAGRIAAERSATAASEARHGLSSRVDAFLDALAGVRAEAGVELLFGMQGVLGTLLELVEVDDSVGLAFEAAVEHALSAVVVADVPDARAAIAHLRAIGRSASLLVPPSGQVAVPGAVAGSERLRDAVHARDADVARLLDQLLSNVLLVRGGLDQALVVLDQAPLATVVTREGDRFSGTGWRIGAPRSGATASALDAARAQLLAATSRFEAAQAELIAATEASELAAAERQAAESSRRPLPARLAVLEQSLAEHTAALQVLRQELVTAQGEQRDAIADIEAATMVLEDAEHTLGVVADEEAVELQQREVAAARRRELDERARALQQQRRDLDVVSATLAERRNLLVAREREVSADLDARAATFAETAVSRSSFVEEVAALRRLSEFVTGIVSRLQIELDQLSLEHQRRQSALAAHLGELSRLRGEKEQLERESALVAERRQRLEIEQTESRVRYEGAVEALRHELDLTPQELLAEPEPDLPIGMDPSARRRQVERELRELGPVNLLAQEELLALTERNTFLESQLEDIRSTRRELNQVIRAVDEEIVAVFTEAFADVALNFERLITTLFPGGSGNISLTNADDLLESGVEIEARPAGRNVRRLSLLSGGERSLVAMAFLFAVFRSRPSPFYLMDEVEAALDDANLQRFLALIDDFRDDAQLIIVSHQKRTMEVADALYGISMQPGGASKVVSERLRRSSPSLGHASAPLATTSMPPAGP